MYIIIGAGAGAGLFALFFLVFFYVRKKHAPVRSTASVVPLSIVAARSAGGLVHNVHYLNGFSISGDAFASEITYATSTKDAESVNYVNTNNEVDVLYEVPVPLTLERRPTISNRPSVAIIESETVNTNALRGTIVYAATGRVSTSNDTDAENMYAVPISRFARNTVNSSLVISDSEASVPDTVVTGKVVGTSSKEAIYGNINDEVDVLYEVPAPLTLERRPTISNRPSVAIIESETVNTNALRGTIVYAATGRVSTSNDTDAENMYAVPISRSARNTVNSSLAISETEFEDQIVLPGAVGGYVDDDDFLVDSRASEQVLTSFGFGYDFEGY